MAKTKQAEARIADPLVRKPIVDWMLADIGVDPFESEAHIRAYVDAVKQIESSGGRNVTSKTSSAKGDFQWLDGVFLEDLNAAKLYYKKADLDLPAWVKEAEEHQDPRKLTSSQQDELFLIRMYRLADNADLAKTYSGDNEAGRYIYAKYHHTNPDEATISRMDKYLPMPELPAEPDIKAGFEPRLESELAATQMATENGRFPEIQPQSSRVDPTPPPLPQLEEVVPTQRGQVPIPQGPQLEEVSVPERSGRFPEVSVDARRRGGGEILEPIKVDVSKIATTFERNVTPAKVENVYDALMPTAEDEARIAESAKQGSLAVKARKAESFYDDFLPDVEDRPASESFEATQLRRGLRTTAQGLSSGTSDELEAGLRALFSDTPYGDARAKIMEDINAQRVVNPTTALFQDIAGGVLGGGALVNQLVKRGASAGTAGAMEGALMGAGYGEGVEGKVASAAGFAAFGGTLAKAIDWATTPSSKALRASQDGGRTQFDDAIDDGILTQNIKVAQKEGNNVMYRTNKGELKKVSVVSINEDKARGATNVVIKDGDNQYAVPLNKIEKIEVKTDKQISDYESLQDFDNARGQYKPKRQIEEKRMTPEGEEVTVVRDATWRDASTAGELWDAMKDGAYRFYNEKLTGADDMLTRVVSKAVGSRFARASQNAVRYSTLAFTKVAEPMRNVAQLADDDRYFKAMVMDFTNARKLQKEGYDVPTQDQVEDYIRQKLGEEDVKAFHDYMTWNRQQKARHVDKLNGRQAFKENDHIHTQLNQQGKEKLFRGKKVEDEDVLEELEFALRDDNAMNARSRRSMVDLLGRETQPLPRDDFDIILTVDDYMNPFFTDFRRTTNLEQLYQLARVFGLDTGEESFQPAQVFERIEKSLVDRGVEKSAAKLAADTMRDDFVGGSKTPNNWIQALNSVGYAGSLAGPKSAILNFHDVLQTMAVYGPKAFKGVTKDMGIDVRQRGIDQNLGEFRNDMFDAYRSGEMEASALARDVTRKGTDWLMQKSGFAWTDTFGKNAVTKMIIQDAVDAVADGGEGLAKKWGFYFSKRELGLIENQIKKHGTNVNDMTGEGAELMEELFFAGLGQQQLISSSGRPAAWSRNPDFRFMWALRGFAIKQQALALRQVVENIAEGNTKDAVDYMKRYVLFAAGGFGLVNESRQWLMGDGEFSATGLLMGMGDQIVSTASINTIGLNDYQWGRMMQNGVTLTFLESIVPIGIDVPKDMVLDVVDAIDNDVKGKEGLTAGQRIAYPVAQLPLIKQPSRLFSNLEDNIGLPNPMRQFTDMYIETEVPKDAQ